MSDLTYLYLLNVADPEERVYPVARETSLPKQARNLNMSISRNPLLLTVHASKRMRETVQRLACQTHGKIPIACETSLLNTQSHLSL